MEGIVCLKPLKSIKLANCVKILVDGDYTYCPLCGFPNLGQEYYKDFFDCYCSTCNIAYNFGCIQVERDCVDPTESNCDFNIVILIIDNSPKSLSDVLVPFFKSYDDCHRLVTNNQTKSKFKFICLCANKNCEVSELQI
jgi:hypothetical protein